MGDAEGVLDVGRPVGAREDEAEVLPALGQGHERLATQMAENLRVLATAKTVTEDLLSDVAKIVGQQDRARAYGRSGVVANDPASSARGIAVNRAL